MGLVLIGGLLAITLIVATVASWGGGSGSLADVCSLVNLKDGPIHLSGLEASRRYFQEVGVAARRVADLDLTEIADSYERAAKVLEGATREDLPNDPAFWEAMSGLKTSELVRLCIDHGLIDERFRDGLPG